MVEEKDILEAAQTIIDESDLNTTSFKTIRKKLKKQFKCSMAPFKQVLKKAVTEMVAQKLASQEQSETNETNETEESFHLHYTPSMAVDMEVSAEVEQNEDENETSPQSKKSSKQKGPKQRKHKKRQHVRDEEIAVVSDEDGSDAGVAEPEEPIPSLLNQDDIDWEDDQTTGQISEDKILPAFLRQVEEEEYIPNAPQAGKKPKKSSAPRKPRTPTPKQQQDRIAEIYKESSKIYRDSELVIPLQTTAATPTYADLLERSKKRKEEYLARKARARPSSANSSKNPSPQKQDKPTTFTPRLTDPSQDSSAEEDSDDSSDEDSSSESGEDSMEVDSVSSSSFPVMPSLPMGTIATPAMTLDLASQS